MSTLIFSRVESESRSVMRQRKIIINRLRDVDVVDRIVLCFKELGDSVGCGSCVVTTYGHEKLHVVVLEQGKVEVLLEILVSRFEAAHLKVRTASVEVGISLEEIDVFGASLLAEESSVAFVETDYPVAVRKESFCN